MADAPTPAAAPAASPAPAAPAAATTTPAGAPPATGGTATPAAAAGAPAGPQATPPAAPKPGDPPAPAPATGPEKHQGKTAAEWAAEANRNGVQARKAQGKLTEMEKGSGTLLSELKADPMATLLKHGITGDQLVEALLKAQGGDPKNGQPAHADPKLAAELEAVKKRLDDQVTAESTREERRLVDEFNGSASKFLQEHKEHEYCSQHGQDAIDLIREVVIQHYQSTADENGENGERLSVADAVAKVEAFYETQAERFFGTEKAKKKYGAPAAAPSGGPTPGAKGAPGSQPAGGHPPQSGGTQSLTNALESGAGSPANGAPRSARGRLSIDDAIAEASQRKG